MFNFKKNYHSMPQESLFSSFQEYDIEDWKALIVKDLKGAKLNTLISETPEGIDIAPMYHGYKSTLQNFSNPIQTTNDALPVRHWVNNAKVILIDEKKANTLALEALNSGADGIIFEIQAPSVDFTLLMNDIKPAYCSISFKTTSPNYLLLKQYVDYLKTQQVDLKEVRGNYLVDPIELRDAGLYDLKESIFQEIKEGIDITSELPYFNSLHISGLLYHNAGANKNHELSFLLAKTTEYFDKLTDLGLKASEIINATSFSMAFGSNYFMEIAKAKVLRKALYKILSAYNQTIALQDFIIIGHTSNRTKSALDFNVNLLRNTTEAMAAVLAGCNEIYIAPHDEAINKEGKPTFKRIALNISNILKEEAHLNKIADPTVGSYYLEALIEALEEKSWTAFLALEKEGDYQQIFDKGTLKKLICQDDNQSADEVVNRRRSYIGANMYQNIGEKLDLQQKSETAHNFLQEKRVGWKVENIRSRTENHVNKHGETARPYATIIKFATDPTSKAKADFAYSFLGMAGIKIVDEIVLKGIEELSAIVDGLETSLIIYCYQERPQEIEANLQHANSKILIAGQEKDEEGLKSKGLYSCIHRHVKAYSFLHTLLNDLNIEG